MKTNPRARFLRRALILTGAVAIGFFAWSQYWILNQQVGRWGNSVPRPSTYSEAPDTEAWSR